jgi:hypothetical protein
LPEALSAEMLTQNMKDKSPQVTEVLAFFLSCFLVFPCDNTEERDIGWLGRWPSSFCTFILSKTCIFYIHFINYNSKKK